MRATEEDHATCQRRRQGPPATFDTPVRKGVGPSEEEAKANPARAVGASALGRAHWRARARPDRRARFGGARGGTSGRRSPVSKTFNIVAAALIVLLAVGLYKAKSEADLARDRVAKLEGEVAVARAQIKTMSAEAAYLENPDRVETLARKELASSPRASTAQANLRHRPGAAAARQSGAVKAQSFPTLDERSRRVGRVRRWWKLPRRAARIRVLAIALMLLFAGLTARAVQLAIFSDPQASTSQGAASAPMIVRAESDDRNGVLLATTVPAFQLTGEPARMFGTRRMSRGRSYASCPILIAGDVQRRLEQREKDVVFLRRDLTPRQREQVFALGLPGVDFRDQERRVYPQGALAAHALGFTNAKREGAAGVELGLDPQIRRSGAAGDPMRLSLDVRVQHALEAELDAASPPRTRKAARVSCSMGALAKFSRWRRRRAFNPNAPPRLDDKRWLNRAAGAVYEMGSTLKPFTVAMAMDAKLTSSDETFDLSKPIALQGNEIKDDEPLGPSTPLPEALAKSSNIMAATLALRVGAARQKSVLTKLGLYDRAAIDLPESARPLPPNGDDPLTVAVLGYGHGMAMSLAALSAPIPCSPTRARAYR